jgi:heme oxygenase (biliverdin-IX-beta and delta-forming)
MPGPRDDPFEPARQLWAGRFQGVISTHSAAEPGYPFGSLVPYCLDRDGLPLLLFSHLAQHARNLDADPRCALTLSEPVAGDIQRGQRLTCIGTCAPCGETDADAIRRYLSYFPDGRMYYERLNFRPYRLQPTRFHYNGGFAAARWLGKERVLRRSTLDADTETAIAEALASSQGTRLAALLPDATGGAPAPLRIAGIDPWGLDLGRADRLRRLPFPRTLTNAREIGAYLDTLPPLG